MPETPPQPERSSSDADRAAKLPYDTPRLRELGSVADMTRNTTPGGGVDDGFGYPVYVS